MERLQLCRTPDTNNDNVLVLLFPKQTEPFGDGWITCGIGGVGWYGAKEQGRLNTVVAQLT